MSQPGEPRFSSADDRSMRLALRLAQRAFGETSPNPMVGTVLVKGGKIIGQGWHRRAGGPHAEIEALRDAQSKGFQTNGATLYVTLEPCSTHGRTPPCTEAIIAAGIKRVVGGATDPNPKHSGKGFKTLKRAGIAVAWWGERPRELKRGSSVASPHQELADECKQLNEAFNHWIVHRTPFVTVKAAMTLDGKIATATGESKWITGEQARTHAMKLRQGADAVLVGINTVLLDNPSLTLRPSSRQPRTEKSERLRRIVLDSAARTPLTAGVVSDARAALTTIVVSERAPQRRVAELAKRVKVLVAPPEKSQIANRKSQIDLRWLLKRLGAENVVSLLVEGGGEVNASFLMSGLAHRVAFFYAPKILGGRSARKAVAGDGIENVRDALHLHQVEWSRFGPDLFMTGRVVSVPELQND